MCIPCFVLFLFVVLDCNPCSKLSSGNSFSPSPRIKLMGRTSSIPATAAHHLISRNAFTSNGNGSSSNGHGSYRRLCTNLSTFTGISNTNGTSASGKHSVKKVPYNVTEHDDYDRDEIHTYEEVARLYPRTGQFRPIVLIGPPGVGRNELKRRLIELDPDKYKTTIPCNYKIFKCLLDHL